MMARRKASQSARDSPGRIGRTLVRPLLIALRATFSLPAAVFGPGRRRELVPPLGGAAAVSGCSEGEESELSSSIAVSSMRAWALKWRFAPRLKLFTAFAIIGPRKLAKKI